MKKTSVRRGVKLKIIMLQGNKVFAGITIFRRYAYVVKTD